MKFVDRSNGSEGFVMGSLEVQRPPLVSVRNPVPYLRSVLIPGAHRIEAGFVPSLCAIDGRRLVYCGKELS